MERLEVNGWFVTPVDQADLNDKLEIYKENGVMCAMMMHNFIAANYDTVLKEELK